MDVNNPLLLKRLASEADNDDDRVICDWCGAGDNDRVTSPIASRAKDDAAGCACGAIFQCGAAAPAARNRGLRSALSGPCARPVARQNEAACHRAANFAALWPLHAGAGRTPQGPRVSSVLFLMSWGFAATRFRCVCVCVLTRVNARDGYLARTAVGLVLNGVCMLAGFERSRSCACDIAPINTFTDNQRDVCYCLCASVYVRIHHALYT